MMGMSVLIMFLFAASTGGATDLLDLVPAEDYWRAKNIQVTPALLQAELAAPADPGDLTKLIEQLGHEDPAKREQATQAIRRVGPAAIAQLRALGLKSEDPEIAARSRSLVASIQAGGKPEQIRRLMAIRTAGDMKIAAVLPQLKVLAASNDVFESDYAAAAIAAIENRPYTRPHASAAEEAWRLPKECTAVVHLAARGGRPATLEEQKKAVALLQSTGFGATGDPAQAEQMLRQQLAQLIEIAETIGNVRLDGVTLGVIAMPQQQTAQAVIMVHGTFDGEALHRYLVRVTETEPARATYEGMRAIHRSDGLLLMPNNRTALATMEIREGTLQKDDFVAAFKKDQFPLKGNEAIGQLVKKVDTTGPVWGVIQLPDFMRKGPMMAVEWATLTSKSVGAQGLSFTVTAKGRNADDMGKLAGVVKEGLQEIRTDMKRAAEEKQMPPQLAELMVSVRKTLDSITVQVDPADGAVVHMTGAADLSPTHLLGFSMMGMWSVRSPGPPGQAVPAPAPNP